MASSGAPSCACAQPVPGLALDDLVEHLAGELGGALVRLDADEVRARRPEPQLARVGAAAAADVQDARARPLAEHVLLEEPHQRRVRPLQVSVLSPFEIQRKWSRGRHGAKVYRFAKPTAIAYNQAHATPQPGPPQPLLRRQGPATLR
jgi:hypothetical protein